MAYNRIKFPLPSRIQHQLATVKRYRKTSIDDLAKRYTVRKVTEGRYLNKAKKLHASVYLAHDFVVANDVTTGGYLTAKADPHAPHAEYFVAIDSESDEVVALVRQIHQQSGHQLPVFRHGLAKTDYSHVHRDDVVEISAFAKKPGTDSRVTLLLFREMLQHSRQKGHQYWVFACDSKVYRSLKTLFGKLLQKTGPEAFYMGSLVVPAEVNLDRAAHGLRRNYRRSVPPLRQVRKFLYDSIGSSSDRAGVERPSRTAFWDQYARAYDGLLHLEPYRHLVDHVSSLGLESDPKRTLDLGCGTGNVTKALLEKSERVEVDAVDWSPAMLRYVPRKANSGRLTVRRRDLLEYLSTTRRRYDVIILNNVVYTVAAGDRELFWRLIEKRLNKGGRVIVADPDTGNSGSLLRDHMDKRSFASLLRPRLIMVGLFDAAISFMGLSKRYSFMSQEALLKEATAGGLRLEGEVGRCYGGHSRGIDLLFALKKP